MKNIILFICTLLLPNVARAQINLVLNPSFEEYSACPDMVDEAKYAIHWMSLDSAWSPPDWAHVPYGVPEYCNTCSTDIDVSVPINSRFTHSPRSGNGMMQLGIFYDETDSGLQTRDYLQGHILHPLLTGHSYAVSFFATLEQGSFYAINHICAYLDDGTIDTTSTPGKIQNQYSPQIVDTEIINDTLNWVKIQGNLVANGSEKLITIGDFFDLNHTHFIAVHDTTLRVLEGGFWAYYLIDDVSVIDCDNIPFAGNDTLIHPGDSAWLGPHEQLLPYTWYVLGSSTPIDSGGGFWVHPTVTTTYVLRQDLCGQAKFDTVKVRVWPDTVNLTPALSKGKGGVVTYPNPSSGVLIVEHAAHTMVSVFDVVGREVFRASIRTDKETLDISPLDRGVYVVRITDAATGVQVVREVVKE